MGTPVSPFEIKFQLFFYQEKLKFNFPVFVQELQELYCLCL